jgi:L,D-transpeptidase catalytic domain
MYKTLIFSLFLLLVFCENNIQKNKSIKSYVSYHKQAMKYCKKHNLDTTFYFLVDLSIHSGKNRFFVVNLENQKNLMQNLVTHGSCDVFTDNPKKWEKAKMSNKENSHCSMKGKFKIGNRDSSSWGIGVKYWLHGLETSNSNAEKRVVVLHSWSAVKNEEIYPKYSPLSWGCPAVSDEFMRKLDKKLKNHKPNVLLWIIE